MHPQTPWVFVSPLVLWCCGACSRRSLQHSHRTVAGLLSGLSVCLCFNTAHRFSEGEPPSSPPLHHHPSFFSVSFCDASLSSPHHQSRTRRWFTIIVLEHSATLRETQEKGTVVISNPCRDEWSLLLPYRPSGQFVSHMERCSVLVFPHKEDKSPLTTQSFL